MHISNDTEKDPNDTKIPIDGPTVLGHNDGMASHHSTTTTALRQIFGTEARAVAAYKLLQSVSEDKRGMLALALAVGDGDGEGAAAFRALATRILAEG